ncbi:hypothetical protein [Bradyrhizobium sp. AS23.2]|uniref:hypothetical protein n=1 Tax=Bradyrhizobium sp. AS23.2 TaxID=1680155 RepID=UPI00142FDE23|nr:hypothetical protein [Bradyrhizobium sp. AS23.2]
MDKSLHAALLHGGAIGSERNALTDHGADLVTGDGTYPAIIFRKSTVTRNGLFLVVGEQRGDGAADSVAVVDLVLVEPAGADELLADQLRGSHPDGLDPVIAVLPVAALPPTVALPPRVT